MHIQRMTTDELLMSIGKPGIAEEIERRRQSRADVNRRIKAREVMAARSRIAGR